MEHDPPSARLMGVQIAKASNVVPGATEASENGATSKRCGSAQQGANQDSLHPDSSVVSRDWARHAVIGTPRDVRRLMDCGELQGDKLQVVMVVHADLMVSVGLESHLSDLLQRLSSEDSEERRGALCPVLAVSSVSIGTSALLTKLGTPHEILLPEDHPDHPVWLGEKSDFDLRRKLAATRHYWVDMDEYMDPKSLAETILDLRKESRAPALCVVTPTDELVHSIGDECEQAGLRVVLLSTRTSIEHNREVYERLQCPPAAVDQPGITVIVSDATLASAGGRLEGKFGLLVHAGMPSKAQGTLKAARDFVERYHCLGVPGTLPISAVSIALLDLRDGDDIHQGLRLFSNTATFEELPMAWYER